MSKADPNAWEEAKTDYWKMSGVEGARERMRNEEDKVIDQIGLEGVLTEYKSSSVRYSRDRGQHETGFSAGSGIAQFETPSGIEVEVNAEAEYDLSTDTTTVTLSYDGEVYQRIMPGKQDYGTIKRELSDFEPEITDLPVVELGSLN